MDELKMEGLELPDTGVSYDDLPDASEGLLEEASDTPRPSDSMDNFSDLDMPVLSEMDGSEISAPAEQEGKPVALEKPAEPKPMFEDMSAPARQQSSRPADTSARSTYQSTGSSYQNTSGSYQSVSGTSNPRVSSSMDDVYNARMAVDPVKYEKGKRKTRIIAGVGIAVYGYSTLMNFLSLMSRFGLSTLLDFGLAAALLYLFIRFFRGSNTAKETLATLILIDVVFNIIGIITAGIATIALSGIGLGVIGGFLAIIGLIALIARCVMLYFLVLDDDITEYSKNKQ